MLAKLLQEKQLSLADGPAAEVVLQTRVQLFRNIIDLSFAKTQDETEKKYLHSIAKRILRELGEEHQLEVINLQECDAVERLICFEKGYLSRYYENSNDGLLVFVDDAWTVMRINELDHFRFMHVESGRDPLKCYESVEQLEERVSQLVTYSFSDQYGYLTADPAFVGTGLNINYLVHLPALEIQKRINDAVKLVADFDLELRAVVRNGKIGGQLFYLNNRFTLGKSENDYIEESLFALEQLVNLENNMREDLLLERRTFLEDRIFRSYGIIQQARLISYTEAMDHLSNVRLGIYLGLIKGIKLFEIDQMFQFMLPAHLQGKYNEKFENNAEINEARALTLRNRFAKRGKH